MQIRYVTAMLLCGYAMTTVTAARKESGRREISTHRRRMRAICSRQFQPYLGGERLMSERYFKDFAVGACSTLAEIVLRPERD